jgi:nucleotide-binding universal stress UspA family protein
MQATSVARRRADEIWPGLHALACVGGTSISSLAFQIYAWQIASLLQGRLSTIKTPYNPKALQRVIDGAVPEHYDLVLLDSDGSALLEQEWFARALLHRAGGEGEEQIPSLLIGREPVWPLQRILLLIRGEATDATTIEWGVRLAGASGCQVTVLVVLPEAAAEHGRYPMSDILTVGSLPGRNVRQALTHLLSRRIDTVLKLNQGPPEEQVRQELSRGRYDMVILTVEPQGRLLGGRLGSLVQPLMHWTLRPILLARPLRPLPVLAGEEVQHAPAV